VTDPGGAKDWKDALSERRASDGRLDVVRSSGSFVGDGGSSCAQAFTNECQ
jgi:hypothetical protein